MTNFSLRRITDLPYRRIAKWSVVGLTFITLLTFFGATIYPRIFGVVGYAFERGLGWATQDGKTAAFWYGLGAHFGDWLSQERFEYLSKTITRENIDDVSESKDTPETILFSKLDAQDAQRVAAELKRLNITANPSEPSQSIRVPANRVYCLRIDLAAIGLPSKGPVDLGPMEFIQFSDRTEFSNHVTLYRNVEQEIAKSISCLPSVKSARVHLAVPMKNVTNSDESTQHQDKNILRGFKPSAAIMAETREGATVSVDQIHAIQHLAAISVPDLGQDKVAVIDQNGYLLSTSGANQSQTKDAPLNVRSKPKKHRRN